MSERRPMLYARVEQETLNEAQKLADEHYDGNLSMLVRIAIKRFTAWLTVKDDDNAAGGEQAAA